MLYSFYFLKVEVFCPDPNHTFKTQVNSRIFHIRVIIMIKSDASSFVPIRDNLKIYTLRIYTVTVHQTKFSSSYSPMCFLGAQYMKLTIRCTVPLIPPPPSLSSPRHGCGGRPPSPWMPPTSPWLWTPLAMDASPRHRCGPPRNGCLPPPSPWLPPDRDPGQLHPDPQPCYFI